MTAEFQVDSARSGMTLYGSSDALHSLFRAEVVCHRDKNYWSILQLLISGLIIVVLLGVRDFWRESGHFSGI